MAPDGGSGSRNGATSGRSGGGSRHALKKGPWTTAEDAILMEYVKRHGEGNWNAVQRNSGLMRCGKSCRLRWANHLRPNLRKGSFSAEEERLIIELHAKLGNKWARMASQLPGRTDNEIKNYWNTRVKRRQRAGLPIYPQDIQQEHHHQPPDHEHPQPNSSSPSLSSLLSSSSQPQKYSSYSPSLSLFNFSPPANPSHHHPNSSYLSNSNHQFKLFRDRNGGLALSLSPSISPFPSPSPPLFNQGFRTELLKTHSLQFNSLNFDTNPRAMMGDSINPIGLVSNTGMGLPSIQSPVPATTPASSCTGSEYVMATSSDDVDDHEIAPEFSLGNSGLLEDLLEESQALTRAEMSKKERLSSEDDKGKEPCVLEDGLMEDDTTAVHAESVFRVGNGDTTPENHWEDSSSPHSSVGIKAKKNELEEMNSMDDDLFMLLNNFPSIAPLPDWYNGTDDVSNGQSSNIMNTGTVVINNQREASSSLVATTMATGNHDRNIGSCCWNNMPGIC